LARRQLKAISRENDDAADFEGFIRQTSGNAVPPLPAKEDNHEVGSGMKGAIGKTPVISILTYDALM